jgi:hypothetical protein
MIRDLHVAFIFFAKSQVGQKFGENSFRVRKNRQFIVFAPTVTDGKKA